MSSVKAVSLGDVARRAGVSSQTVSRVANGLTNVQPSTRERVEAAMESLGYRPNRAARALRTGRFRDLGVVMFTLSSYGNMRTLEAITRAAAEADHSVTVITPEGPEGDRLSQGLARLDEQAVDGVILLTESPISRPAELQLPSGLPFAVIASVPDLDRAHVDTDQAGGAASAVRHLLELGHETVHHIAGPADSYAARGRAEAWRAELTRAGRPVPPVIPGDWSAEAGYAAGRTIAERAEVTAVFAANDHMALGLLRACHEAGRAVPASLSVVGFDDVPEAGMFWPPLTTVRQDFETVGRAAVAQILTRIDGGVVQGPVVVPTTLVLRGSTAAPRSG